VSGNIETQGHVEELTEFSSMTERVDRWISVGKSLPELCYLDDVLVKVEGKIIPAMRASKPVIVFLEDDSRIDRLVHINGYDSPIWETYGERVTYWKRLPAPPRDIERCPRCSDSIDEDMGCEDPDCPGGKK